MSATVAGDPASCSQLGGALRQLAARLRTTGKRAHDAFDSGDSARPGPVLVRARRQVDTLDAATAAAAREVDRVGSALQAHASDLAEAVAQGRQVVARAEAAGLRVDDGSVVLPWGVTGVADRAASTARDSARAALQGELDALLTLLSQRRARLVATLAESQAVLATHAGVLRR